MSVKPPTRFLLMLLGISFLGAPLAAQHVPRLDSYDGVVVRILQSNNAGDVQHIIDPLTNEVVGVIEGCPRPHNLFAHPKGRYYYCTNETESTLDGTVNLSPARPDFADENAYEGLSRLQVSGRSHQSRRLAEPPVHPEFSRR